MADKKVTQNSLFDGVGKTPLIRKKLPQRKIRIISNDDFEKEYKNIDTKDKSIKELAQESISTDDDLSKSNLEYAEKMKEITQEDIVKKSMELDSIIERFENASKTIEEKMNEISEMRKNLETTLEKSQEQYEEIKQIRMGDENYKNNIILENEASLDTCDHIEEDSVYNYKDFDIDDMSTKEVIHNKNKDYIKDCSIVENKTVKDISYSKSKAMKNSIIGASIGGLFAGVGGLAIGATIGKNIGRGISSPYTEDVNQTDYVQINGISYNGADVIEGLKLLEEKRQKDKENEQLLDYLDAGWFTLDQFIIVSKVKEIIEEQGKKLTWLQHETGIKKSTFNSLLNVNNSISLSNAMRVATILNLPVEKIFEWRLPNNEEEIE